MTIKSEPLGAIEGSEILIVGQDIKHSGRPVLLKGSDEILFPLKVTKQGKASIKKEKNPKIWQFRNYSMLNKGDRIEGKYLWGVSSDVIGPGDIKIGRGGRTHRHSGQELLIKGICFVEIVSGWRGTALLVHPKQDLTLVSST